MPVLKNFLWIFGVSVGFFLYSMIFSEYFDMGYNGKNLYKYAFYLTFFVPIIIYLFNKQKLILKILLLFINWVLLYYLLSKIVEYFVFNVW